MLYLCEFHKRFIFILILIIKNIIGTSIIKIRGINLIGKSKLQTYSTITNILHMLATIILEKSLINLYAPTDLT